MGRRGASDEAPCRRDGSSRSRMSIMNRWKVAVAAVVMQLGLGSLYAWSVFRQPLSAHYDASVTSVNVVFFVAIFVFGISTLAAGFLLRHVGPRFVGVAGGVLFGTGVFLSAFAEGSLSFLYFTYGIVAAVGGGLGYIVPVAVLPKWFPDRPGLAYGLAVVGFGIGPVINVPLISTILSATGGPFRTFAVLGISYAAMIGAAAWFVRNPLKDRESPDSERRDQVDEKPEGTSYYLRSFGNVAVVRFMGRVLTEHDGRGRSLLRCQGDGRLDRWSHRRRSLRFRDDRRGMGHGGAAGVAYPLGQDLRGQCVSRYVPGAGRGLPLNAGTRSWILCVVLRPSLGCGVLLRGRLRDDVGVGRRLLRPPGYRDDLRRHTYRIVGRWLRCPVALGALG